MTPSTDWKEVVLADEAERFTRYAEALRDIQRRRARGRSPLRALHGKGNLGLQGELTVLADLPEHAKQGMFAKPGTYRTYLRYSNGSGGKQADSKPDVRGLALKIVGVDGKKIIKGMEDAKTQDFLLIRTASTPFRDADEFVTLVRAAESPVLLPVKLLVGLGFGRGLEILKALARSLKLPTGPLAETRYFSALAVKYGPYAVHVGLNPKAAPRGGERSTQSPDFLAEELAARLKGEDVVYDLAVQFYRDPEKTPIEDASVEWRETDSPFVPVARLTIPKQDPFSERGKKLAEYIETLAFDPWHALEEHRPLGNMMRARDYAYRASTKERGAAGEPDGAEPSFLA